MPNPSLHSTALRIALCFGCASSLILAIPPARSLGQQPYSISLVPGSQSWTASPPERLAQNPASPEIIRPATPTVPGTLPSGVGPAGAPPSERVREMEELAAPFGVDEARFEFPPGVGVPRPSPKIDTEYRRYVEREVDAEKTIQVVVGHDHKLEFYRRPRRVYMPGDRTARVDVVTEKILAVAGLAVGTTVLQVWVPDPADPESPSKDHILSYLVEVLPGPDTRDLERKQEIRRMEMAVEAYKRALKKLEGEIKGAFPDSAVRLSLIGEQVLVRGEAKDVVEAAQVLRIVADHAPNRRRTQLPQQSRMNQTNPGLIPGGNVFFNPRPGQEQGAVNAIRDLVQGSSNPISLTLVPQRVDEYQAAVDAIREIELGSPGIVNLLRVPGEQQVMLMVSVAEVNRTAARTIGMDFSIIKGGFAFAQNTGQGLNIGTATAGVAASTGISAAAQALRDVGGNLPTAIDNGNVLMAIQALRTLNFARSLAEPNLTTLNGRPASFQAGGSFPIPNSIVLPGGAAQSVTYQNFGVALQFTPFITDRNRIRLQLNASVSTPSTATTEVSGAQVPSQITQRQFNTTVELREGQTLTVAGLIQNNFSGQSNRVPFWGDLPIIGRTGGVDSLSSGEQELVVLVTPVLVHPLDMCKTPPLPGNNIFEPGDVEFYLLGHLEGRRSEDYRASVRTDFCRQKAFCECNDRFIIGPCGTTYGCCKLGNGPCPRPVAGNPPPAPVAAPSPEIVQPPAR